MFGLFQSNKPQAQSKTRLALHEYEQVLAPASLTVVGSELSIVAFNENIRVEDNGSNSAGNLRVVSFDPRSGAFIRSYDATTSSRLLTSIRIDQRGEGNTGYDTQGRMLSNGSTRTVSYVGSHLRNDFDANVMGGVGSNANLQIIANGHSESDRLRATVGNIANDSNVRIQLNGGFANDSPDTATVNVGSVGRNSRLTLQGDGGGGNDTYTYTFGRIHDYGGVLVDAVGGTGDDRMQVNANGHIGMNASLGIGLSAMSGADDLNVNINGNAAWGSLIWVNLMGNDYNMGHVADGTNLVSMNYNGEMDGRILFNLQAGGGWGGFGDWLNVNLNFAQGSTGAVGNERDDSSVIYGGRSLNDMGIRVTGAGRDSVDYQGLRMVGVHGAQDIFHVTGVLMDRGEYDFGNFNSDGRDSRHRYA